MRRITHVGLPQPLNPTAESKQWLIDLDEKERVVSLQPMAEGSAVAGESWNGDWLSPMGVDLQINGGLGLAFPELTQADLPRLLDLLDLLWQDGVAAICPTLVTCGVMALRQSLQVLREARQLHGPQRCALLGAHLEGPFLAEARRGAHPLEHLCPPSLLALDERINGFEDDIALTTVAPELPGASVVMERLKALGIVISLGHSTIDAAGATQAFQQGVAMLTHSFNAMPGLHHRDPGPIGAACRHGGITMGLIADGVHVDPTMAVLLQRLAPEQVVLVSDALAPYGLEDGQHHWDERVLLVNQGTCRLEDGTLAGVSLPLLEGCKRLASWSGEPGAAIWAGTIAPRKVLGEARPLHELLLGQSLTNLLRWQWKEDQAELIWQRAA